MRKSALLLILPLGLVGCGKGNFSERSATANAKANVFRYPIVTKPTTMDPGKVQDGDTIDVIQQVYEGLVGWDEKNEVEPKLAERWDVTDGGKTYVFHLRKGAKFTERARGHRRGLQEVHRAQLRPEAQLRDRLDLPDRHRGRPGRDRGQGPGPSPASRSSIPTPSASPSTSPAPTSWASSPTRAPSSSTFRSSPIPRRRSPTQEEMVGTGGFRFTKVAVDQEVDMAANEGYWGGKPSLSEIRRPYVPDASTRLNMPTRTATSTSSSSSAPTSKASRRTRSTRTTSSSSTVRRCTTSASTAASSPQLQGRPRPPRPRDGDRQGRHRERHPRRGEQARRRHPPAWRASATARPGEGRPLRRGRSPSGSSPSGLPRGQGHPQAGDVVPQQPPRHPSRRRGRRRAVEDKNLGIKTTFAPGVGRLPRGPQQEDPPALPHELGRRLPRRRELPQHPPRKLRQREQDQLQERERTTPSAAPPTPPRTPRSASGSTPRPKTW